MLKQEVEKLILVLANFASMIVVSIEAVFIVTLSYKILISVFDYTILLLEYMQYIHYLLCFQKSKDNMKTFIDSDKKVNTIALTYIN